MVNQKKNRTNKSLVITSCDIDCRKEEDEANFPNDKKIICFLCRKWSHRHCTGEEEYCLTYVWACRYCRGIAENTSHIHTIISDLKQTITGLVDKISLLQPLQSSHISDLPIHTSETNNDTTDSIVIQTPQPTCIVHELTYDELSDTSSDDEFITLSQLSINESESRVPESLDALLETLASPIPLLHSTPRALETVIVTNTDVPDPNVVETGNDAGSSSHAPLNEEPKRVIPPKKRTIYHDVYIGNVRGTTTEDHVRGQLTDIGVSEIGTITRLPSRYNSAYRVFIGDLDIENTVYNRNNWNARIKVEPFRKRPPSRKSTSSRSIRRNNRRDKSPHPMSTMHRTPRRDVRHRPPRFDRTPNGRGESTNHNMNHSAHQLRETSNNRGDCIATMEQQTVSTARYTNDHRYGEYYPPINVVDHTVTPGVRDYAHTSRACHLPSVHDIRNTNMVIPQRQYHEYGNVSSHHRPPPMDRHLVHVEQRPHYHHSGHNSPPACETASSNIPVSSYVINRQ